MLPNDLFSQLEVLKLRRAMGKIPLNTVEGKLLFSVILKCVERS